MEENYRRKRLRQTNKKIQTNKTKTEKADGKWSHARMDKDGRKRCKTKI